MKVIPYGHQWIDQKDIQEVVKVLKSDWITQGPKIKEFEDALCKYTGAKYAVAVANGTAALHLACLASGIKFGDEVITSPITFLASANCVLYCHGKPVFADILATSGNIDPDQIQKKISKKTKVIIPVHFGGQPCDMEKISKIARKNKLVIIEDAAHAVGSTYKGSKIGSCKYSDMTTLSFHPVKTITTGEGGAILTNNVLFYKKLLQLRSHGMTKTNFKNKPDGDWYYEMQSLGFNYRITDIQAALGSSQLKKIGDFNKARRKIVSLYKKAFKDNPYFDVLVEEADRQSCFHLFCILLKDKYKNKKSQVFGVLKRRGIGAQVHYIPVYLQPYYQSLGYKKGSCPIAEDFYHRTISIPLYPLMKNSDVQYVIKNIMSLFKQI